MSSTSLRTSFLELADARLASTTLQELYLGGNFMFGSRRDGSRRERRAEAGDHGAFVPSDTNGTGSDGAFSHVQRELDQLLGQLRARAAALPVEEAPATAAAPAPAVAMAGRRRRATLWGDPPPLPPRGAQIDWAAILTTAGRRRAGPAILTGGGPYGWAAPAAAAAAPRVCVLCLHARLRPTATATAPAADDRTDAPLVVIHTTFLPVALRHPSQ